MPAIISVHGYDRIDHADSQWNLNLPTLKKFCRPVTVDLWGHGQSPAPEARSYYSPSSYALEFEKIRKEVKSENENTLKLYDDLKRLEETVTGHVDVIESLESKTKEVEGFKLQEQIQEDRGDSMGGSSATAMDEGRSRSKAAMSSEKGRASAVTRAYKKKR